ncbi:MAG: hypothetical protein EON54_01370 [Alcaligenaceae bacterium]|nr:MAG: hypothetical protein EON54_01370 [Alcaligenaceae bacterium]
MAAAVQSLLSLTFLVFLVFFLFRQHRIDSLRQQLFFIRDSLFDDAVAGKISFDSRAYVYTRTVLNGLLRFSHRVSVSRFVLSNLLLRKSDQLERRSIVLDAMKASSESDRQVCERYLQTAHMAVLRHLLSSPVSVVLFVPFISFVLTCVLGTSLIALALTRCKAQLTRLDVVAYAEGRAADSGMTDPCLNSRFAS